MDNEKRSMHITRDSILGLLSATEIERVKVGEEASKLAPGEEYVDLEELDLGVLVAKPTSTTSMGNVLAKKAVLPKTWTAILEQVFWRRIGPIHDGA